MSLAIPHSAKDYITLSLKFKTTKMRVSGEVCLTQEKGGKIVFKMAASSMC